MAMEQRTRYRRVRFANEGEEEEGEGWRVVGSVLFASCSRRMPCARGNKFVSKSAFVGCARFVCVARAVKNERRAKSRRKKIGKSRER